MPSVAACQRHALIQLRSDWKPGGHAVQGGIAHRHGPGEVPRGRARFRGDLRAQGRACRCSPTRATKNFLLLDVLDNVNEPPGRGAARVGPVEAARRARVPQCDHARRGRRRSRRERRLLARRSRASPSPRRSDLAKAGSDAREKLKSLPAFFDATGLEVTQNEATSKDGTKIPYFVVMRDGREARRIATRRSSTATAASRSRMMPNYSGTIGAGWLEQRRRLRARQHPRRRRVRARVAPGGAAAKAATRPTTTSSRWPRT